MMRPSLRALCLALIVFCTFFSGACKKREQEQRKIFIEFLEAQLIAATDADSDEMSDAMRKRVGSFGRHFDVIVMHSRELDEINERLASEKAQIADYGPIPMDRIGSERARIEQLVAALSRSLQALDVVRTKAHAAKAALEQPEDVRTVFDRVYAKKISEYAAASQARYAVQRDFYAEALRMSELLEKHKDAIQFADKRVTIDDPVLLNKYNVLQKSLQEKFQIMQAPLASKSPAH